MADQNNPYNLTAPGPWQTAFMQAGNGALLGYLPEVVGLMPGSTAQDVEKVRQGLAMGNAANPKSSWAGFGAGLIGPGAVAKTGYKFVAKPVLKAALGLAADAGLGTVAKAAAGKVGTALGLSGLGLAGYSLFGGDSGKAPPPASAPTAADQKAANPKSSAARKPDWYDQMAGIAGVDRDTVKEMVRQDGGMRIDKLQALNGMKPRAPTYRDLAMSYVMDTFEKEAQAAQQSGDAAQQAAVYSRLQQTLASILGADPLTMQQYTADPNAP